MGRLEAIDAHVARLARETAMQRARPGPVTQRRLRDAERRRQRFLGSDSDDPVAGPSTGPGTLTGAGTAANPHLLVEIQSDEEAREEVRRVVIMAPEDRRSAAPEYEHPPSYASVLGSVAAAKFKAAAEDAAREEEEEGERTATEEDLYAATE